MILGGGDGGGAVCWQAVRQSKSNAAAAAAFVVVVVSLGRESIKKFLTLTCHIKFSRSNRLQQHFCSTFDSLHRGAFDFTRSFPLFEILPLIKVRFAFAYGQRHFDLSVLPVETQ